MFLSRNNTRNISYSSYFWITQKGYLNVNKTYWISVILLCVFFVLSTVTLVFILYLSKMNKLSKGFSISSIIVCIFLMFFIVYSIVPYMKDCTFVLEDNFVEEDVILVEFTRSRIDADGNGQIHYSHPKFYCERTHEYIILNISDVELGQKYRIRYLPNTKLCEIVYCYTTK